MAFAVAFLARLFALQTQGLTRRSGRSDRVMWWERFDRDLRGVKVHMVANTRDLVLQIVISASIYSSHTGSVEGFFWRTRGEVD